MYIISDILVQEWWHRYGYTSPLFFQYYIRHGPFLTGVDDSIDHIITSNYTTYLFFCVLYEAWTAYDKGELPHRPQHHLQLHQKHDQMFTLVLRIQSWNRIPYQWYSGPRLMTHVWICHPTVLWGGFDAWTTPDRGGLPHRQQHHLQLHLRQGQMLPWFLYYWAWSIYLISGIVIQG